MQQIRRVKAAEINKLRGAVPDETSRDILRKDLVGLGWRVLSRRWRKTFRIFEIRGTCAAVRSICRSERDHRETTEDYIVEIPFVMLLDGREVVDYKALKNAVVNHDNVWSPER